MQPIPNQSKGYKPQDKERLRLEKKYKSLLSGDLRLGELVSYVGNYCEKSNGLSAQSTNGSHLLI